MAFSFLRKTLSFYLVVTLLLGSFAYAAYSAYAESGVPNTISYQGRLTDSGGNALGGSGTAYYFRFSLWDSPTVGSGNKLWPTSNPSSVPLTVRNGIFNVDIGDTNNGYPDTLDYDFRNNKNIYLQVEISADNSTFETLSPRSPLTSSPFAQVSSEVSGLGQSSFGTTTALVNSVVTMQSTGAASAALSVLGSASQSANIFNVSDSANSSFFTVAADGKVGIGIASPSSQLAIQTGAASVIGSIIKGAPSQTADLQQWQNSDGTVLAKISSSGSLSVEQNSVHSIVVSGNLTPDLSGVYQYAGTYNSRNYYVNPGVGYIWSSSNGGTWYISPSLGLQNQDWYGYGSGSTPILSSAWNSQFGASGSLTTSDGGAGYNFALNDSGSLSLTGSLSTGGTINVSGSGNSSLGGKLSVGNSQNFFGILNVVSPEGSYGVNPLYVVTSTGANLLRLLSYDDNNNNIYLGTKLLAQNFNGSFLLGDGPTQVGLNGNSVGIGTSPNTSYTAFIQNPSSLTKVSLGVKAVASQTADLQQWQNSSGAVLANITSSGNVGIGSTTPSAKLSITGVVGSSDVFQVASSTGGEEFKIDKDGVVYVNDINGSTLNNAYLYLTRNSLTKSAEVWYRSNSTGAGWQTGLESGLSSNDFLFRNYFNGKYVRITANNASLGVNVNPLSGLDVSSAAFGTYAGTSAAPANSVIIGGNLGIASTSPNYPLTVSGASWFGGDISLNANTIQASTYNVPAALCFQDKNWCFGGYNSGSNYWLQVKYWDNNDNLRGFRVVDQSGNSVFATNKQNSYFQYGNLGVGTTTPATTLSVTGNGYFTGGLGVGVVNTTTGTIDSVGGSASLKVRGGLTSGDYVTSLNNVGPNGGPTLAFGYNSDNYAFFTFDISNGTNNFNTKARDLRFYSTTDTNGFIYKQSTGNVGIGTTTPTAKLDVDGAGVFRPQTYSFDTNPTDALMVWDFQPHQNTSGGIYIRQTNGQVRPIMNFNTSSGAFSFGASSNNINSLNFAAGGGVGTGYMNYTINGVEAMRIINGGNVGIGTSTPTAKLSVVGTSGSTNDIFALATSTGQKLFSLSNTGYLNFDMTNTNGYFTLSKGSSIGSIQIAGGSNQRLQYGAFNGGITVATFGVGALNSSYGSAFETYSSGDLSLLGKSGTTLAYMTNAGNFGIGTTTPLASLHIASSTNGLLVGGAALPTNTFNYIQGPASAPAGSTLFSIQSNGTLGSGGSIFLAQTAGGTGIRITEQGALYAPINTAFTSGSGGANLSFGGNGNTNTFKSGNNTSQNVTDFVFTSGGTRTAGNLFQIQNNTVPQLTVDFGGNLGIGTTTPTAQLHTTGTVRFSNFGAGTLQTDALGNVTIASDERLKNIQGTFDRGLADVLKLNPILYKWNEKSGYEMNSTYAGFSAQNVQSAIPEAVATSSNGYLALQDRPLIAVLVNAVKELDAKVELIFEWFSNDGTQLKVQGDVCVDDVCITKDQFKQLIKNAGATSGTQTTSSTSVAPVTQESTTTQTQSTSTTDTASSTPTTDTQQTTTTTSTQSGTTDVTTTSTNTMSTPAPTDTQQTSTTSNTSTQTATTDTSSAPAADSTQAAQ